MSASAILKLQNAGFTAEQVTALAELIDTQAATKADVESARHQLDGRIIEVEQKLNSRITDFDHKLDHKIDAVEHRLEMRIIKIEADVTVLKWMMGFILAFQVAIFAKLVLKI